MYVGFDAVLWLHGLPVSPELFTVRKESLQEKYI